MSKFEVGDLVKGLPESNYRYSITNENMTKGVVKKITEDGIVVKVLEHAKGRYGTHVVDEKYFEKIGHLEPFDREKFIGLLNESKAKAAEYLSGANLSDADLSDANLSDADLSGANLRRADLSGADLRRANLSDANLSDADLRRADLSDANLSDADLSGADLSGADLRRANLSDANLSDADLRRADLSDANLSDADLSGSQGLLDAINYMESNFERTDEGYIVYKSFNSNYTAPDRWKIEPGEVIEEVANSDRTCECGCGINVAPLEWVKNDNYKQPYKLLIRWEWLPGVVVPYNTDGKIRCSKAQILEAVE